MIIRELCRRKLSRFIIIVALLLLLQYAVNLLGYYHTLPFSLINNIFSDHDAFVVYNGTTTTTNSITKGADFTVNSISERNSTSVQGDDDDAPSCPQFPPNLIGSLRVSKKQINIESVDEMHAFNMAPGGFFSPPDCKARFKVAVVIPFRDREAHLNIFLNHLVPMLKRQQLEFAIYIVDQALGSKFNRGMLMNIGFVESLKDKDWDCFIFHDVDLLPENDHNIYSCSSKSPRHMSAAVDKFKYKLPYAAIFGGVSAFKKQHFLDVNGFSNVYFGWGAEDDDIYRRITRQKLKLTRYPLTIARYTMLSHGHEGNKAAPDRFKYLNGKGGANRMTVDGVNSLKYKLLKKRRNPLYTRLLVQIDQNAIRSDLEKKLRSSNKNSWWPAAAAG